MTVLAEARRATRRGEGSNEDVARHLLDEWRTELGNDARRGPAWLTCRAGGVEELERLVHVLDSS